ncbi:MAG: hypothetical protein QW759_03290 [Candidatus Micrarchaeaceae archaeon]
MNRINIILGIIILIADLYWMATSYTVVLWLALGIIILIADIIWIALDAKGS